MRKSGPAASIVPIPPIVRGTSDAKFTTTRNRSAVLVFISSHTESPMQ